VRLLTDDFGEDVGDEFDGEGWGQTKTPPAGAGGAFVVSLSPWCSFGRDFGDRGAGGGFVDDGLVGGVGGDQGLDREVVHRPGQAAGDLVD